MVLAQSGEFALVLFSLAQQSGLLSDDVFQQLLLVVLLSMITTPALAQLARRLVFKEQQPGADKSEEQPTEAPIVLAGFGRVGHRIGEILTLAGKPFVALDSDATIVKQERAKGHPVFYGDARQTEIFKSACAHNAEAIIVTLNDPEATEELLISLRQMYPDINIYARGHSLDDCVKLLQLGATGVVSENFEASMELARKALMSTGFNTRELHSILVDFRKRYNVKITRDVHKQ
jgi:voltage-gated potassium channel Kch